MSKNPVLSICSLDNVYDIIISNRYLIVKHPMIVLRRTCTSVNSIAKNFILEVVVVK